MQSNDGAEFNVKITDTHTDFDNCKLMLIQLYVSCYWQR